MSRGQAREVEPRQNLISTLVGVAIMVAVATAALAISESELAGLPLRRSHAAWSN